MKGKTSRIWENETGLMANSFNLPYFCFQSGVSNLELV